jgi:hypothetical protein
VGAGFEKRMAASFPLNSAFLDGRCYAACSSLPHTLCHSLTPLPPPEVYLRKVCVSPSGQPPTNRRLSITATAAARVTPTSSHPNPSKVHPLRQVPFGLEDRSPGLVLLPSGLRVLHPQPAETKSSGLVTKSSGLKVIHPSLVGVLDFEHELMLTAGNEMVVEAPVDEEAGTSSGGGERRLDDRI